jgi:hypothetical protein
MILKISEKKLFLIEKLGWENFFHTWGYNDTTTVVRCSQRHQKEHLIRQKDTKD